MSDDPLPNKWIRLLFHHKRVSFWKGIAIAVLYLFMALVVSLFNSSDIPQFDELNFQEGRLATAEMDDYGIDIQLLNIERSFRYYSSSGCLGCVWRALQPGSSIVLAHEDGHTSVYQIVVDGRMVRSYDEVRAGHADNDRWGFWLRKIFLMISTYFFVVAYFVRRYPS